MESGDASTPHSSHFDDIYFAVEDGLAESRYVFLEKNNLPSAWVGHDRFTICETGFGTGLNFLCAWTLFEQTAAPHQKLHYYSFEKYPLSSAEIGKYLAHWAGEFDGRLEKLCAAYPLRVGGWHTLHLTPRVTLTLMFDDVNCAITELDVPIDCWFLDGHAPAKNPDMWSDNLFHHMGRLSCHGSRFATFTAAGFVRRGLTAVGFDVHKDRGFGRKRDMSTGIFRGAGMMQPDAPPTPQKIAIIGGGIAGASCAAKLITRGAAVDIYDKNAIASGGSGNLRGLFNPRFTAQQGFDSDFYGPAFALAHRQFSMMQDVAYQKCGSLHLILDDDKRRRFMGMADTWGWHDDHLRFLNADETSAVAGIPLTHDAIFLPDAGMVCPAQVTKSLAVSAQYYPHDVINLDTDGASWRVTGDGFTREYDAVIIAAGKDVPRFAQTEFLPVQAVRGQISYIDTPPPLESLRTNLCYGGYCTAPFDRQMVVGSTFQHWLDGDTLRDDDHHEVIAKLSTVTGIVLDTVKIRGGRASFRCAARDRVPVIGEMPNARGLYISAAHGSHGLLSAQIAAQILVAQIYSNTPILPRSVTNRLSPARFLK